VQLVYKLHSDEFKTNYNMLTDFIV